jgi:hypothetical protein
MDGPNRSVQWKYANPAPARDRPAFEQRHDGHSKPGFDHADEKNAIAASDHRTLRKYDRFLQVILARILKNAPAGERRALERALLGFYASRQPAATGCN